MKPELQFKQNVNPMVQMQFLKAGPERVFGFWALATAMATGLPVMGLLLWEMNF